MNEWKSPDGRHLAQWTWGGEMWMSGPEWGHLRVDGVQVSERAAPQALWSDDARYLAFVDLHIQDVPTRQGAEGMSYRVVVLRLADFQRRVSPSRQQLAKLSLLSFHGGTLTVSVNAERRQLQMDNLAWEARDGLEPPRQAASSSDSGTTA